MKSRVQVSFYLGLVNWMMFTFFISNINTDLCIYANKRLINYNPKRQWEDSNIHNKLRILGKRVRNHVEYCIYIWLHNVLSDNIEIYTFSKTSIIQYFNLKLLYFSIHIHY